MNIGIMGTGLIAECMARTIQGLQDGTKLYAVASRDLIRAESFAESWGAEKAYGSYEEMLQDKSINLVYIATPHSEHYANAKLCLKYAQNCLVEKAFCANSAQTREILYEAEAKKVFVAEAMWTRYLPSTKLIKGILEKGAIGQPKELVSIFSVFCSEKERIWNPELCGGALLDLGVYSLTSAAMFFGTNITSINSECEKLESGVDAREKIILTYHDGRKAIAIASVIGPEENKCCIYGTEGRLEFGPINNPEYIRRYTTDGIFAEQYDIPKQITGYEYELLASIAAMKAEALECEEITHSETLRIMNWMDHLRAQWGIIYPFERKEDLCVYSGNGIKRHFIIPFRRYWLNCLNCIANSLVDYAYDMPAAYYCNNDYVYDYTEEKTRATGYEYKSLLPVTDDVSILVNMACDDKRIMMSQEADPIGIIKDALDKELIVRLAVDLYHWVDSGMHYKTNHIMHYSLVVGYDDNRRELMVFETGDYGYSEFRVPYERAILAMQANPKKSSISKLNRDGDIHVLDDEDIAQNAVKTIGSIDVITSKMEELWNVEGMEENEVSELYAIIPSHMYSIENRLNLNATLLLHNASKNEALEEIAYRFRELGQQYENLKNLILKLMLKRDKKERVPQLKSQLELLLKEERNLWKRLCIMSNIKGRNV